MNVMSTNSNHNSILLNKKTTKTNINKNSTTPLLKELRELDEQQM